jgi:hypothetical protein
MRADQSRPQRGQLYQATTHVLSAAGATGRPHSGHDIEAVAGRASMPGEWATIVPTRTAAVRPRVTRAVGRAPKILGDDLKNSAGRGACAWHSAVFASFVEGTGRPLPAHGTSDMPVWGTLRQLPRRDGPGYGTVEHAADAAGAGPYDVHRSQRRSLPGRTPATDSRGPWTRCSWRPNHAGLG